MTVLITTILVLVVKALEVVLVVSLVAGSVVAAKKYLFGDEKIDSLFKIKEAPVTWECSQCKATLQAGYKYCHNCGAVKGDVPEKAVVQAV